MTPVKELSKPESSPSLEGKQHLDSPADGAVEPGEEPTGHILKKNQVKDDKVEVLDTHGGVQAEGMIELHTHMFNYTPTHVTNTHNCSHFNSTLEDNFQIGRASCRERV